MSEFEHSEGSNKEQLPFAAAEGQAGNGQLPARSPQQAGLQVDLSEGQQLSSTGRQGPSTEGDVQQQARRLPGPNDSTVMLDASWIQSPVHSGSTGIVNAEALGVLNQAQLMVAMQAISARLHSLAQRAEHPLQSPIPPSDTHSSHRPISVSSGSGSDDVASDTPYQRNREWRAASTRQPMRAPLQPRSNPPASKSASDKKQLVDGPVTPTRPVTKNQPGAGGSAARPADKLQSKGGHCRASQEPHGDAVPAASPYKSKSARHTRDSDDSASYDGSQSCQFAEFAGKSSYRKQGKQGQDSKKRLTEKSFKKIRTLLVDCFIYALTKCIYWQKNKKRWENS